MIHAKSIDMIGIISHSFPVSGFPSCAEQVTNTAGLTRPVSYLGDDERLSVLQATLQGEAPRRSSMQPGLHQHPAASFSSTARRLLEPRPATALHAWPGGVHTPGSYVLSLRRIKWRWRGGGDRYEENELSFTSALPSFIYNSSLRAKRAGGVRAPSRVSCKVHSWSAQSGGSSAGEIPKKHPETSP